MVNQMDAEFDRITRKEIPSQLATAFISLGYEARLLDVQNRKKLFEKKANQLKTDIETLTDSLMKLMIGEKVDRKGENGMSKTTEYIQKYGNRYCYEWFMRANIDRVEEHISEVERKAEDMKKRMAVLAVTRAAIQIVGMILILKKLSKEA